MTNAGLATISIEMMRIYLATISIATPQRITHSTVVTHSQSNGPVENLRVLSHTLFLGTDDQRKIRLKCVTLRRDPYKWSKIADVETRSMRSLIFSVGGHAFWIACN